MEFDWEDAIGKFACTAMKHRQLLILLSGFWLEDGTEFSSE
jgi:hypothetical protein